MLEKKKKILNQEKMQKCLKIEKEIIFAYKCFTWYVFCSLNLKTVEMTAPYVSEKISPIKIVCLTCKE